MVNFHVFRPVKGVIAGQGQVVKAHVFAVHGKIIAPRRHVPALHVPAAPQRFRRVGKGHIRQRDAAATAEVFRRLDDRIAHRNILGIPDAGARRVKQRAVIQRDVVPVPERVFPAEDTTGKREVPAFFERRLAVGKGAVGELQPVGAEKRPLTREKLLFDRFHVSHPFRLGLFLL